MEGEANKFYKGQAVIAVDAITGSRIKNGQLYTVANYEYRMNPVNGLWFYYIDIVGHGSWLRPSIFAPYFPPMQAITFEKITEENPVSVN